MFSRVTEDGRPMTLRGLVDRKAWFTLATVACFLLIPAEAFGQADETAKIFHAKVVDMSEGVQRITVPLNGSVTVETTMEVARADVIANQIADVQVISPVRLLLTGEGYGRTTLVLHSADDQQHVFEVSVELDLARLNEAIRTVDPLANVMAQSVLGNIVLTGQSSSSDRAQRIAELAALFLPPAGNGTPKGAVQNHVDISGEQQVLLRCVVAEVNRAAARDLGVNGFLAGENMRDAFLVNQIGGINPINIGAAGSALATQNIPFVTDDNGIPLRASTTLSLGFPRAQTQLFIRAMADNSLLKVLAEPNLVAISGETATFLAGGEFPIPVPQGLGTVTIDFRQFGIRLNFTPIVRGDQRIRLRVAPEVSELDFTSAAQFEGFVIPGLTARSTETTVELGSGETIAIAGLLSEQVRALASRVPGLGDVPILGTLFRSVNYRKSLTELVILVTPEIVAPLDAHQQLRLPTDGIDVPTDYELFALGLIEGADTAEPAADDGSEGSSAQLPSEPGELSVHGPWGHEAGGR